MARRFQGSVQDARREVLLPADGDGPLQPEAAAVQGLALGPHRRGPNRPSEGCFAKMGLPEAIRSDNGAPVRIDGDPRPVRAERVVDAARHRAPADPALEPAGERPARAHAPGPEAGNHAAAGREPAGPAEKVRSLPAPLQRRAASRRDRRGSSLRNAGEPSLATSTRRRSSRLPSTRATWRCVA